ncbi:Integral membrane protein, interacts with FtsH [Leuconostoc inhae]|uniref:Bax inhibitor-1/YccA family protein n=1 Tax=Leuconostoc gelidum subsp. gelidum TaxID=1607839 RepID=A0ABS7V2M1_LEUGE|nr:MULTISPECIES: Bax inhibitor-1/YccA family protein [Leuconostoc]MBZ5964300.1 Bax inhibitor-1/YccA family protein [Leuconostoc gelidum subsp. gelidum]MBZ5975101.1 Bax inhibitor-1/YccA family protein [Leuconostoc gelidum subsp. gelidum]MBZ5976949.1 Bax inhibitor-1/YccA family protein [Leuconostoc gelidum subsp. gelidum]MBZ5978104.1 Bax inhibitor-1/YccA family protein [Leuconostoc gelidum subsp. gelidum]MBZ5986848.1 Bax inhibitor-1/YccA family protein [Leuconostoc gelidum subsp. gelidum]
MDNFNINTRRDVTGMDAGMRAFFKQTYSFMAIAVMVTAITGFVVQKFFLAQVVALIAGNIVGTLALFGIQILIMTMIGRATFKNPARAFGLLMAFAVVEGLTLGLLLAIYTGASVTMAFVSAAAVFGGMAAYGIFTKRDLTGMGSILFGLLIGLVVASVVNILFYNGIVSLLISGVSVIVFSLYTAYDNQNLKLMYNQFAGQADTTGLAVNGALRLYLDFVNLFFALIRIFGVVGGSRD